MESYFTTGCPPPPLSVIVKNVFTPLSVISDLLYRVGKRPRAACRVVDFILIILVKIPRRVFPILVSTLFSLSEETPHSSTEKTETKRWHGQGKVILSDFLLFLNNFFMLEQIWCSLFVDHIFLLFGALLLFLFSLSLTDGLCLCCVCVCRELLLRIFPQGAVLLLLPPLWLLLSPPAPPAAFCCCGCCCSISFQKARQSKWRPRGKTRYDTLYSRTNFYHRNEHSVITGFGPGQKKQKWKKERKQKRDRPTV